MKENLKKSVALIMGEDASGPLSFICSIQCQQKSQLLAENFHQYLLI